MDKTLKIQVIARAASILRALSSEGRTLAELAKITDLPRSTVQRIVAALEEECFVETGESGIRLGWGLSDLARFAYSKVASQLRVPLEQLFERTRETVDISTNYSGDVHFLDRIISDQVVRVVPVNNRPRPLFAMANGKAILSCMPDSAIRQIYRTGLTPLTKNTICNINELINEIKQVRADGFSYDNEEHAEGISAIGIALPPVNSCYYALSVVAPTFRYKNRLEDLKLALQEAAADCKEIITKTGISTSTE